MTDRFEFDDDAQWGIWDLACMQIEELSLALEPSAVGAERWFASSYSVDADVLAAGTPRAYELWERFPDGGGARPIGFFATKAEARAAAVDAARRELETLRALSRDVTQPLHVRQREERERSRRRQYELASAAAETLKRSTSESAAQTPA